ncbi:DNA polymerase zeta catalytic subunit-like [Diadema antillarum]|uniref:DNA polymerase zeta catalytic subunit-like n=1 Tax=Diadema antillarum TaxID=105358 RepID=UPI003A8BF6AB
MFSVRVVTVNHYQSTPIDDLDVKVSDFRGADVNQVPVIRVFGSTPLGQKTCLHVHGVFPYIYIPYDGTQPADHYMRQMATSLDTALQVAQGKAASTVHHVFKISLVSGLPLYGYHKSERQFLKIYFYNPAVRKRAVELLQNGAVMNKVFQPHESHVPFNLQFLIDYNLYGMNMLNLAAVKFRKSEASNSSEEKMLSPGSSTGFQINSPPDHPTPLRRRHSSGSMSVCTQYWDAEAIPASQLLGEDVARQSTCELEVDAVAADILNRMDLQDNAETNPGLVGIWEDERQRREQLNQMDQLLPPSTPDRGEMSLLNAEENWNARLREIVDKQLQELQEMESQIMDSDEVAMETESSEEVGPPSSQLQNVPCTPANELEIHMSENPDSEPSQRQVFSGDVSPVVNEELVQSILEASQRLSQSQSQDTQDEELANLLVDLVHDEDDDVDLALSGRRSMQSLREHPGPSGIEISDSEEEDSPELEAEEEKEMSQAWLGVDNEWEDEEDEDAAVAERLIGDIEDVGAGRSQKSMEEEDYLPQLDGSSDIPPKEGKSKCQTKSLVGRGRLGEKSPRRAQNGFVHTRPLASDKIARTPLKHVDGPLREIGDAIEVLTEGPCNGAVSKESASRTKGSRQNSTARSPKTTMNGSHRGVPSNLGESSRRPRRSNSVTSRSLKGRGKQSPSLKGKRKKMAKFSKRAPTLQITIPVGKGMGGIKSPRTLQKQVDKPFFTEKMARSPHKELTGPLERYANAIEYNIAPSFQYAEAIKPKKRLPLATTASSRTASMDGGRSSPENVKRDLFRHNSVNQSCDVQEQSDSPSMARSRRNSARSVEDDVSKPRRRSSQRDESTALKGTNVSDSPGRLRRSKSLTASDVSPQGEPSASDKSVKFARQSSFSAVSPVARALSARKPSDDDFKVIQSPVSSRRGSKCGQANVKKKPASGKAARKMSQGKRSRRSYCQHEEQKEGSDPMEKQLKAQTSPHFAGCGRSGKKSPRGSEAKDRGKPFVSDNIIRSPHKPMEGPIAVYNDAIGFKMAPRFQYAESVKPKPKVILSPIDISAIASVSVLKSPKTRVRSTSTVASGSAESNTSPAKVPVRRNLSVPNKTSPKPRKTTRVRTNTKRSSKDSMSSHDPTLIMEQSFVFDAVPPANCTLGRGHMGSRSPKDLTKSEPIKDILSSSKLARSPLKNVHIPDHQVSPCHDKAAGELSEFKHGKKRSAQSLSKSKARKNIPQWLEAEFPDRAKVKSVSTKRSNKVAGETSGGTRNQKGGVAHGSEKGSKSKVKHEKGLEKKARQQARSNGKTSQKDKVSKAVTNKKGKTEDKVEIKPKKGKKPSPLQFDPVSMPYLKLNASNLVKLKLCKELNPQLVLRKLCLDEESWGEVIRNALYRDLDRQVKRKLSEENDQTDAKRARMDDTPPGLRGVQRVSPRKEQLKSRMAAKEAKYKGALQPFRRFDVQQKRRTKIVDVYGGGPDNKTWNYVPPIKPPIEETAQNPIIEICEPGKDESRDVMWRLACYSPQRPEQISSPPRCWSPLGKISDAEEEEEEEEQEQEEDDKREEEGRLAVETIPEEDIEEDIEEEVKGEIMEEVATDSTKKEETAAPGPISDNEMDIIERNLGQISDFSVYEKMLQVTSDGKANQQEPKSRHEEFTLEHFPEDVSGIDDHLHGNSDLDAISNEFAKLDKTDQVPGNHGHVIERCGKENQEPNLQGQLREQPKIAHDWSQSDTHTSVDLPSHPVPSNDLHPQGQHQLNHTGIPPVPDNGPLVAQNAVPQGTSHSNTSSQVDSNSSPGIAPGQGNQAYLSEVQISRSSSYGSHSQVKSHSYTNSPDESSNSPQITPGQKAQSYFSDVQISAPSSYSSHSPQYQRTDSSNSGTSSSQYPSQRQDAGSQGAQEPTCIPETDSEHSSDCSPPQVQYSMNHSTPPYQNDPVKESVMPAGTSRQNESLYYHSNLQASQSMYEMSNHSFNQSSVYGGERLVDQSQGYNQSANHLPYPSPGSNQRQGYPPPYPSPQPPYPSPNHHHPSTPNQHHPPTPNQHHPSTPNQHHPSNHEHPSPSGQPPYRVSYPQAPHPYPDSGTTAPAAKPKIWRPVAMPPTDSMVRSSLQEYGLPEVHHQCAYWGNPQDHAGRQREGPSQTHVQSMLPSTLQHAETPCGNMGLSHWQTVVQSQGDTPTSQGYSTVHQGYNRDAVWMPSRYPPPRDAVTSWMNEKQQCGQRHHFGHEGSSLPQYQQPQQPDQHIVPPPHQSPGRSMPLLPSHHNGNSLGVPTSPYPATPSQSNTNSNMRYAGEKGICGTAQVGRAGGSNALQPLPHSDQRVLQCQQELASPIQRVLNPAHQPSYQVQQHPGPTPNQQSIPATQQLQPPAPKGPGQDNSQGTASPHSSDGNSHPTAGQVNCTEPTAAIQCNPSSNPPTPTTGHHLTALMATPLQASGSTPKSSRLAERPGDGNTPPMSSTPLRPLTVSPLAPPQPGVTPIASQKPGPLSDVARLKKNPNLPNTPAQSSPVTPLQKRKALTSQIEGPTPKNMYGFKVSQGNVQDAKALHVVQHVTTMSLEIHTRTRKDYHPDPDFDPIRAIFYCIHKDDPGDGSPHSPAKGRHHGNHQVGDQNGDHGAGEDGKGQGRHQVGMIMVDLSRPGSKVNNPGTAAVTGNPTDSTVVTQRDWLARSGVSGLDVTYVQDEKAMFEEFVKLVRRHDPDILAGFEIQQLSWGYLFQRAAFLEVQLCQQISRLPDDPRESHFSADKDAYGADHMSEITIAGRIVLNLWRIIRHEVNLNIYTFENVAYHVLHQRLPLYTFRTLTDWFDHNTACYRWRTIEYYATRVRGNMRLIQQLDLIGRTSELARLFGIEFYSVLSRGSQYRVESMMLRQAKCANYIAVSPSVHQRSRSKAPECIPLVMEPESRFYEDPVIVLDFQSLYPSMMIAYNYCFSTCLGRVEHIAQGGEYTLGCTSLSSPPRQLEHLLTSDGLHISPNGIVFVKHSVRHGVLPRMLDQILNTRIMVKKALKDHKGDKVLERMLDNRQLGLKLIANVTYGYTSANFSGRMPCIEVGDSVVRKGRETLERAIKMVNTTPKWGARVVYGDTDSLFVLVKGVTKSRAFEIGREIVAAVTAENPKPVKLKLEKVYKPCVLQAKKRYVGYKYESPDQAEPDFDAKGIETVRRDSCPAVAKMLERSLKILFETKDVSKVKRYVQQQFQKLSEGRIGLQDLMFAKEYRGRQYYRPGACVPALEIAKRKLSVDRRSEPRVSERVPYVVVHGSPGLPLIQLVRTPQEYLRDPSYNLNTPYYITRQIVPALNRVFGMMGVDTLGWYQELPRVMHVNTAPTKAKSSGNTRKGTISQYFSSLNCAGCDRLTKSGLCESCKASPQTTVTSLMRRVQQWDRARVQINKVCSSCCGFRDTKQHCATMDCPVRFELVKAERKMDRVEHFISLVQSMTAQAAT